MNGLRGGKTNHAKKCKVKEGTRENKQIKKENCFFRQRQNEDNISALITMN